MSIRRLFWLGAAVLFSIAALVAIAAVLGGSFGTTQEHILEMCGIAFVCGAATLAGLACIDRGVIPTVGWLTVVLGVATFVVWTGAVWQDSTSATPTGRSPASSVSGRSLRSSSRRLRLFVSSPRLLGTVVPATWAAAVIAAAVSTEMILAEDGGPWKLVVVLVILTALGYALTPALQRFWAAAEPGERAERLLGTLGGIDVFAVRGDGRSVTIGSSRTRLSLQRRNRPARALLSLELRSARTLSVGERAELFTAAYEGYVVPMRIDEASLAWMEEKFDFDLDASRIAYRDGEPVGLANLAVRGRGRVDRRRRRSRIRAASRGRRGAHARRSRGGTVARRRAGVARGDRREHGRLRPLREARLRARAGRRGLDPAGRRGRARGARGSRVRGEARSCPSGTSRGSAPTARVANYDDVRGLVTESGRDALLRALQRAAAAVRRRARATASRAPHVRGRLRAQPPCGRSGGGGPP